MSQSQKSLERSIKNPDRFQAWGLGILAWLDRNRILVTSLAGLVVLSVVGYNVYGYLQQQRTTDRLNQLGEIEAKYQDILQTHNADLTPLSQKIDDIDKKISESKDPAEQKQLGKEKRQLQTEHDQSKPDLSPLIEEYNAFFQVHKGHAEGWAAALKAASIRVARGDYPAAQTLLQELLASSQSELFYQTQARLMLMSVSEEIKDFAEARKQAEALVEIAHERIKPFVLMSQARILTQLGEQEEAQKVLDKLIEDHATTTEADKARSMKAFLSGAS